MMILLYGSDGTGKSIQAKSIAESLEPSEHWSLFVKNRKLYKDCAVPSIELLRFNPDQSVNPYGTMDAIHDQIAKTIKENVLKCIVIDEITLWRTYAQPYTVEWWNKTFKTKINALTGDNILAWEHVNEITVGALDRLNTWAEINECLIVAITSVKDVYTTEVGFDGKSHSVSTGQTVANAHANLRKLADVRIKLERDGSKGKGFYAIVEKYQDWMVERPDVVKIWKDGIMTELMLRGVL